MATRTRTKKPPAGTIQVDFSKMKEGGGVRLPEDDYLAKIKSIKPDVSQNNNRMLTFTFVVQEGKYKGKELVDRATLTDKALFKLRDILEACGITVPRRVVNIPIKKLVGKDVGITVVDDEPYNGRIKSKIADYISPDALGEEDDEEEDDEEEEDIEPDEEEDDLDELDRAELKALIKEEELGIKVVKSMSDDDLREAITEARDEEEDDEEEEEPAPKRKAAAKKKPAAKSKKKAKDEDDELEDIDLEDL